MLTIHLTGQTEKRSSTNPLGLDPCPLYHQQRTYNALQEPDTHLVVNSYNTGTGKTRAAMMHLHALHQSGKLHNTLFIAPTNALLKQHADDVQEFVTQYKLDFKVIAITAKRIDQFREQIIAQGHKEKLRKGKTLEQLIANYRLFFPEENQRKGLIIVVNPDIFYYAIQFQYNHNDERNLFERFITSFQYAIIDEFHYYDKKQLASFFFFFAMYKKMGWFAQGKKICLLSATPDYHVQQFLDQLLAENWQLIAPENEPADSDTLPTIPTLTPLTLNIAHDSLDDWVQTYQQTIYEWVDAGLDGAIISDSLKRINRLRLFLLGRLGKKIGRITGPELEADRQLATAKPLILATPTVDIGYNFKKQNKKRQNIDFLVCEARFGDDLIQRIGRAGRILGKQHAQTSQATILINEEAYNKLRTHDNQTVTRAEFKTLINSIEELPTKHNLVGYLREFAITEIYYPLHRAGRMVDVPTKQKLTELHQQLCDLFGVSDKHITRQTWFLDKYFRSYQARQQWLTQIKKSEMIPYNLSTAEHVSDWFKFRGLGEYTSFDMVDHLKNENVLAHPQQKIDLYAFVESQKALTKSLFNFRDSFPSAEAILYDANNLFSEQKINRYDIFHIISEYEIHWYVDRAEFVQQHGQPLYEAPFYGRILKHKEEKLTVALKLETDYTQEEFDELFTGRTIALKHVSLRTYDTQKALVDLPAPIAQAIYDMHTIMVLVPIGCEGRAINVFRHSPFYSYDLHIQYDSDGGQSVKYIAYVGKAAHFAYSELKGAFKIAEKMKTTAIIL